MRGPLIVACVSLVALGCQSKPAPPTKPKLQAEAKPEGDAKAEVDEPIPEGVRVEIGKTKGEGCVRTLCIGGPGKPGAHPNFDLNESCRRSPGIVQRCEGELCLGVWPRNEWRKGLGAMIESLDSDGDGTITAADEACSLRLGGWSTGAGLVLTEIPERLATVVDGGHAKIDHLLAVAPYIEQAEPPTEIAVAANIERAFIYRTTVSTEEDCSKGYPKGPWLSPVPVCGPDTTCYDYDYAKLGDELAYFGRRGNRSGAAIGHCNMSSIVAKIGLENLARGREALEHLIPPYADGTRGGRPREGRQLERPPEMDKKAEPDPKDAPEGQPG